MRGQRIVELLTPLGATEKEAFTRALDLRAGSTFRIHLRRPSGSDATVDIQAREHEFNQRSVVHTVWQDVVEAQVKAEAVDPAPLDPSILLRLIDRLIPTNSLDQLAQAVHETVGLSMGFDRVLISHWDAKSDELTSIAAFPVFDQPGGPSGEGLNAETSVVPTSAAPYAADDPSPPEAATSPDTFTQLDVRDARGEDSGIQLSFYSASKVIDRETKLRLGGQAATYVAGAFNRLNSENRNERRESILRTLFSKTSGVTGQDFFDTLVRQLAELLNVDFVLATRFTDRSRLRLSPISFWAKGEFKAIEPYPIENTPCGTVLETGELAIETGIQSKYPKDLDLVELGVDSYIGISIQNPIGEPIGHLCALDSDKIEGSKRALELLRFFAIRISAELYRIDRDAELQEAITSRDILLELLQASHSTMSLAEILDRSIGVISESRIEGISGKCAIYLFDERRGEVSLAARRELDGLDDCHAADPVKDWYRAHLDISSPCRWTLEGMAEDTEWKGDNEFILTPIRSLDVTRGLLAVQLSRKELSTATNFSFFQAAADTLSDTLERFRNQAALNDAEARVLRSQRLEAVGQLAGGIAHDFNNLLTAILGNADLLNARFPGLSEVASIRRAGESAGKMTSQLLAFTRKQVLQTERVDIGLLVSDVVQMLERIIPESISLQVNAKPDQFFSLADSGQLQQVLMNLVVNARDAMPRGGLLKIDAEEVKLDPTERMDDADGRAKNSPFVLLTVSDSGVGIDEESLDRIFEPFYSTKNIRSGARTEGTGLGLSVVYGIVKQHGGFVDVDSEPERGTKFLVYLAADKSATAEQISSSANQPIVSTQGASVLIVEDEKEVRDIAARLLESLGYLVQTASGGPEALAMFSDPEFQVDTVLLDVVMPAISGLQTFEKLRKTRPHQKVLFMTGHDPTAGLKDLLAQEDVALLNKPFTRTQLGKSIGSLLSQVALDS